MRVLLMSSSSGSQGGGENYLVLLCEGLARLGVHIEVAMSDHRRMDGVAGACASFGSVTRLAYLNTYDRILRCAGAVLARPTIARINQYFRTVNPDLIHVNKQNLEDGLDLLLAAEQAEIRTVATVHVTRSMTQLNSRAGAFRDWLSSRVIRGCSSQYITVANSCGEQLLASCQGLERARVHTVWNGVASAYQADRNAIRADWGCQEDTTVLGCMARLEPQKAPLFSLDLLRRLPDSVHLAWFGDGALRRDFLRTVEIFGLKNRVHFEGWRNDARSRLAGMDIFVLPSEYEGFPLSILEAMSAGLPCVVSDVDGTREAVIDGQTGYLCAPKRIDQWVSRLNMMVGDSVSGRKMGAQGYARWLQHFSLEAMARGTCAVYEKILAPSSVSI